MNSTLRFFILISLVGISGFSQGMLLPLISIIFESNGVSSSVNGFHATSLYIGILLASPFMEKPLRRLGFKPIILIGGLLVFASLGLFPLWQAFWFWFILRLIIGIGDQMLHFGIQTWITSTSSPNKRGRNISIYGFFFGLGFTFGPLMTKLLLINQHLPFIVSACLSFLVWSLLFFIRNEWPEQESEDEQNQGTFKRFVQTWKIAWVAFLPPFGYGFLEASLHGNLPVYAMRIGYNVETLAFILPAFTIGGLVTQMPLGILSDRYGRKNILFLALSGGFLAFTSASFFETSFIGLITCLIVAGMLVGSTFSLGISYMSDLLPKNLLPAGNLMCGVSFSLGSIAGPFIGGVFIQWAAEVSYFYIISFMLLFILVSLSLYREKVPVKYKSQLT